MLLLDSAYGYLRVRLLRVGASVYPGHLLLARNQHHHYMQYIHLRNHVLGELTVSGYHDMSEPGIRPRGRGGRRGERRGTSDHQLASSFPIDPDRRLQQHVCPLLRARERSNVQWRLEDLNTIAIERLGAPNELA